MSQRFTTIEEASDFLLRYSPEKLTGETYTLGRMEGLMARLGNPQDYIPAVHVAGTSGKTSTSYYIRALLQAHGKRTGLTSSPHISSITERVQIDGAPLPDEKFLLYLQEFLGVIEKWNDLTPTYFELLTAFAFWVFEKEKVDYMVIEVGLGGLLDATNVISPGSKISVITPIGLDHTEILGNSTEQIAGQKAGIIVPDSDVFIGLQDKSVEGVIQDEVINKSARLHATEIIYDESLATPLFQQQNFSLARAVTDFIAVRDELSIPSDDTLAEIIAHTPPGRFEVYTVGDKTIILDGAHNPQKLAALTEALENLYDGPFAWLVGFISAPDEKIEGCIDTIVKERDEYIVTQFKIGQDIKSRKSVPAYVLELKVTAKGGDVVSIPDANEALTELLSSKQRTVIVTGSLYLVAQLREQVIRLSTSQQA